LTNKSATRVKAVALLSGGLDSRLAVRLVQEQGVEVTALNYVTPFCTCTSKSSCRLEAKKAAEEYGIKIKVFYVFEDFIEIIKHPKHGHGRGLNPCLDCRIMMFKNAKKYMDEIGASFLVTGEVLGERPMSQRSDAISIIEKESGLSDLIVRPLSAKLFAPSLPERQGLLDRSRFMDIRGRSRKPQIKMAEKLGMNDYPCAAGGCLLTDKDFAGRLKNLLAINPYPTRNDIMLLKVGRQRFMDEARIIIGRDEKENFRINNLARSGDIIMAARDAVGPTTLIRGKITDEIVEHAAKLTLGYGKDKGEAAAVIKYYPVGEAGGKREIEIVNS